MPPAPQLAFRALSDPTRRSILTLLGDHPMTIGQVSDRFDMTRAAVKKHLTILAEGDLIRVEPRGRERVNTLNPQGLRPVFDWLSHFEQFWDDKLADLKTAIETEDTDDD